MDSFNVVFTRRLDDLSQAEWARVNRQEYMQIVTERQVQCPAFQLVCKKTSFSALSSDKLQFLSDTVAVRVNKNKVLLVRVRDTPRILNKISQFEGLKAFNAFNNNIEYLSHIDILRIMVYLLN